MVARFLTFTALTSVLMLSACDKPQPAKPAVPEDALPATVPIRVDDSYMQAEMTAPRSSVADLPPQAAKFITALNSDDEKLILGYQGFEDMYSEKGKLNQVERDHIRKGLRPLLASGAIAMKEIDRADHEFTVLFYLVEHADQMEDETFLKQAYMSAYFACRFDDSSGSWKLAPPAVCFSETDGPYG
ncbi:hypothetical protein [Asticcacaulis machinosus]|uniref:SnoaL-like domain-containing protein n=1 Tax=Asticcacaulis machinosus TaxID=2984211 RepID=A0ABT5HI57_9CAUL|nr:hypothetical protein [Asticcacaulis machinosus]MDC7675922.1 hypothetical protein [Asticcacaulis machinosus]